MLDDYRLYRFPANSRAEASILAVQILHAKDEINEVIEATMESPERIIEELWDTIQACEGALRKFKTQQVRDGYYLVMGKNNERGDYSKEAVRCDDWGLV